MFTLRYAHHYSFETISVAKHHLFRQRKTIFGKIMPTLLHSVKQRETAPTIPQQDKITWYMKSITKLPTAPRLNVSKARDPVLAKPAESTDTNVAMTMQAAWLRAVQHVMAHTVDVGDRFAEEARRIIDAHRTELSTGQVVRLRDEFDALQRAGLIPINPAALVSTPRLPQTLPPVPSAQQTCTLLDEMAGLREKMDSIARQILALSDQTAQIGTILVTVSDIAGQCDAELGNARQP